MRPTFGDKSSGIKDNFNKTARYPFKCAHCDLWLEFQVYWCPLCKGHAHSMYMVKDKTQCVTCEKGRKPNAS